MKIGELIFQQRKKLNLTLEDVGKACGVPKSTVSRWENGIIQKISRDKQEKLCILLDIDPIVFYQKDEVLTPDEMRMLKAYREADDRAKIDAYNMLVDHSVKKEKSLAI